jgi:hypothetical protein
MKLLISSSIEVSTLSFGGAKILLRVLRVPVAAGEILHDACRMMRTDCFISSPRHEVAVVAVALRADRHVELILLVAGVGLVLAQIERTPEPRRFGPVKAVGDGVGLRDDADADGAVQENLVARQQAEDLLEDRQELVAERVHAVRPALGHVAGHAADAGVAGGEARAGQLLEEFVELLALLEAIQKHRPRADIDAVGAEAHQVGRRCGPSPP